MHTSHTSLYPCKIIIMATELKGKVLTVLGPVSPDELGVVLPHEHLLLDFGKAWTPKPPEYGGTGDMKDLPLTIENLGAIRQYPYSTAANIVVDSEEDLVQELKLYKASGGGTLCDVTITGIRTKPESLPLLSTSSGVHIVHGTGYYTKRFIPPDVKDMTIHEISDTIEREIMEGLPGTSPPVRCGIIGEIGCSWPLNEFEKKVLQGSAIAQRKTGAPLIIHPGRNERAPFDIVDILKEAGADLSRTVMSHIDRTILDHPSLIKFAETGCGVELDLFGIECSHYQFNVDVDMPNDGQRIQMVKCLVDGGYKDRVFIAHDIHTKHRLVKYGGHGYSHIINNVAPMMVNRGIPRDIVDQIMIENPKKWLTFI